MPENDKQFYNQGEFVGPTLPTIEPTPYSEWAEQNNISEIRKLLKSNVLGYSPTGENVDWISKFRNISKKN